MSCPIQISTRASQVIWPVRPAVKNPTGSGRVFEMMVNYERIFPVCQFLMERPGQEMIQDLERRPLSLAAALKQR